MATYRIIIKSIPGYNNSPVDQNVQLSNDNIYAIAIMATALLGELRDTHFEIRDKALRPINIDNIIKQSGSVVLEGEEAFELDPVPGEQWINTVRKAGGQITQRYSLKVDGYSQFYLVQFNNNDFYRGLWLFPQWIGKNGAKFLRYLHDGNTQVVINVNA